MREYLAQQDAARRPSPPPTPPPVPKVQPGWYPHPTMVNTQRYWDGARWTDHIAPGAPRPPVAARRSSDGDIIGACILGVVLPIVGFIWGIVMVARNEPRGWLPMAVSVAAFLFFLLLLSSAQTGTTY